MWGAWFCEGEGDLRDYLQFKRQCVGMMEQFCSNLQRFGFTTVVYFKVRAWGEFAFVAHVVYGVPVLQQVPCSHVYSIAAGRHALFLGVLQRDGQLCATELLPGEAP